MTTFIISVKILANGEVTVCYRTGQPSCVYKTRGHVSISVRERNGHYAKSVRVSEPIERGEITIRPDSEETIQFHPKKGEFAE